MKLLSGLVGLLVMVINIVSSFTHITVVYYAYHEVSSWWGVILTIIGLSFADLYWAYQWWNSGLAVFIVITVILLFVLNGLMRGLELAGQDYE
jgi:hypothetical protein